MADHLAHLIGIDRLRVEALLDMRYVGQDFTLPVPFEEHELGTDSFEAIRRRFDEVHQRRYGHHAPDERAEVVNMRVTGFGKRDKPRLSSVRNGKGRSELSDHVRVHFERGDEATETPIYARDDLAAGDRVPGPALIEEYASTTIVFDGDVVNVANNLELIIDLRGKDR